MQKSRCGTAKSGDVWGRVNSRPTYALHWHQTARRRLESRGAGWVKRPPPISFRVSKTAFLIGYVCVHNMKVVRYVACSVPFMFPSCPPFMSPLHYTQQMRVPDKESMSVGIGQSKARVRNGTSPGQGQIRQIGGGAVQPEALARLSRVLACGGPVHE